MDGDFVAAHFRQNHKVIQVPVKDARKLELAQFFDFQPQGARRKSELSRVRCYLREGGAFHAELKALPKFC